MSMERIPNKSEQVTIDELLRIKLERSENEDPELFFKKIFDFVNELKTCIPSEELNSLKLYHVLIGSSDRPDGFDLPEGEIERFIREEL